jgi:hypothetical protein
VRIEDRISDSRRCTHHEAIVVTSRPPQLYRPLLIAERRMMVKSDFSGVILLLISSILALGCENQFGWGVVSAFVVPRNPRIPTRSRISFNRSTPTSSSRVVALAGSSPTSLLERRWNFNEGQGPFGLKKNAEIWNGRVAQVGSVLYYQLDVLAINLRRFSISHLDRCALLPSCYKKW